MAATLTINLYDEGLAAADGLITEIIQFARDRGIDQATLAHLAGIHPESLSRLKKAGSCRLATAFDLARAAGLRTLNLLVEDDEDRGGRHRRSRKAAASIAAKKLSAGRRQTIAVKELLSQLAVGKPSKDHTAHLYGFFEELPIESVHDVVLQERLDYKNLLTLATGLGAEGDTVDWLEEMADDSLAHPA